MQVLSGETQWKDVSELLQINQAPNLPFISSDFRCLLMIMRNDSWTSLRAPVQGCQKQWGCWWPMRLPSVWRTLLWPIDPESAQLIPRLSLAVLAACYPLSRWKWTRPLPGNQILTNRVKVNVTKQSHVPISLTNLRNLQNSIRWNGPESESSKAK